MAHTLADVTAAANDPHLRGRLNTALLSQLQAGIAAIRAARDAVAADTNAVLTDNAILWLAKQASGDVLAPEA